MSRKHVLVIDDEPSALEAMGAALESEFQVQLVSDPRNASDILERQPIDLVVLDVFLNGASGLDLLVHLREKSDVPVLLISGYGTKETVIEGLRSHASDYLDKPFSATQLLDRARSLIAQGPRPDHISERIRHFIDQHYMREWTVDRLAKALNLSVRTMRQTFRQHYRQSVMDFLKEVRMARARELLATTDLPIRKVAAAVGFRDPHYFSRIFCQRIGKSPRSFRAAQRREPFSSSD
jgi:YesN/AraC family two-component response regulator